MALLNVTVPLLAMSPGGIRDAVPEVAVCLADGGRAGVSQRAGEDDRAGGGLVDADGARRDWLSGAPLRS